MLLRVGLLCLCAVTRVWCLVILRLRVCKVFIDLVLFVVCFALMFVLIAVVWFAPN